MFKKKLSLIIVFVLVIAIIIAYMPSLEKIVKQLTNKYGSQVTQTEVMLGGFDLSLRKGEARLSEITVANPSGYKTPYAFELGDIMVKVNVATITDDVIVVENVEIVKPVVTYEMASLTKSNLTDIQKNIASFTSGKLPKKVEKAEVDEKSDKPAKKVIIKHLYVKDGSIQFLAPLMGKEPVELKLPNIHLKDIGKEEKGATIGEITSKVIGTINDTAVNIVSKEQLSKITDKANEEINKVKDEILSKTPDKLKNLFK